MCLNKSLEKSLISRSFKFLNFNSGNYVLEKTSLNVKKINYLTGFIDNDFDLFGGFNENCILFVGTHLRDIEDYFSNFSNSKIDSTRCIYLDDNQVQFTDLILPDGQYDRRYSGILYNLDVFEDFQNFSSLLQKKQRDNEVIGHFYLDDVLKGFLLN